MNHEHRYQRIMNTIGDNYDSDNRRDMRPLSNASSSSDEDELFGMDDGSVGRGGKKGLKLMK